MAANGLLVAEESTKEDQRYRNPKPLSSLCQKSMQLARMPPGGQRTSKANIVVKGTAPDDLVPQNSKHFYKGLSI